MSLELLAEAATIGGGVVAVGGAVLALARYWVRHELRQLRTNGGSHLADKINTTALTVERLDSKIDGVVASQAELKGRFDEHVRATGNQVDVHVVR